MQKVMKRRKRQKRKQQNDLQNQFSGVEDQSIQDQRKNSEEEKKQNKNQTNHQLKGDDETMGESVDENLKCPYQFLKFASPSLHMIFFPHFTVKSFTFIFSMILILAFIAQIIYIYTRQPQNQYTWNCSLFQLQNKYYPRIKFDYQVWRLIVSSFFHSNYAHFVLNILGIQIYGYFIEWFYGRGRMILTIVLSLLFAGFFSNIAMRTSVSTMPSAILFSLLALKIFFLFEYREYSKLRGRRVFIILLLILILGINLIPIFTNNNVDYTSHLGGFLGGLLMGTFLYLHKSQQQLSKGLKALKFISLILLGIGLITTCVLMFTLTIQEQHLQALNNNIEKYCE